MADQDCKICGGTGWIVAVQDGISSANRCNCVAANEGKELSRRAGIPDNYRDASFDNFLLPHDNPTVSRQLQGAMVTIKGYSNNYPALKDKLGLLLVGPQGVGKTHLAIAVLRQLIARGHQGVFFDYQNLLERIRSGFDERMGSANRETYQNALDAEILLLDDLGAHRVTDWVEDTITSLITHRCNYRKPVIITTNFPDPDMGGTSVEKAEAGSAAKYLVREVLEQRIGARARSRLFEMCTIVSLWGLPDYRQRPRRKSF
jgi:DNA replication protein DnaC